MIFCCKDNHLSTFDIAFDHSVKSVMISTTQSAVSMISNTFTVAKPITLQCHEIRFMFLSFFKNPSGHISGFFFDMPFT